MWPFATDAFALPPGGGEGAGGMIIQFAPFILIFIIFWFLIIRPQQKKAKAHRQLLGDLKKGDEVKTDGGVHGTIIKLAEDSITLEISHKVPIRIDRTRIVELIATKREPIPKASDSDAQTK